MSDAYAKEFEKWLMESKTETSDDTEDEAADENLTEIGGSEADEDFGTDNIESDYFDDESESLFSQPKKDRARCTSVSLNDSAPILVDDDDDPIPQQFVDEPPVLEPVTKPLGGSKIKVSTHGPSKFVSQNAMRNYSRGNFTYSRKKSAQQKQRSLKTYSTKDKFEDRSLDNSEDMSNLKTKDNKESGNIFDKFNSIDTYDDAPPPLIPSPEALRLHSEAPTSNDITSEMKHPANSSPDFCAMEADSTSEILSDKGQDFSRSSRLSKNFVSTDVSIECDSTCMLGASPAIVSPASVNSGETEEIGDPGGGETNIDNSNIHHESIERPNFEHQSNIPSLINVNPSQSVTYSRDIQNTSESIASSFQTDLCPGPSLFPSDNSIEISESFPVSVKTEIENEDNSCASYSDHPPVLSVISPPVTPFQKSRKKRHTIDSLETFSRSGKRPRTVPSPRTDGEGTCVDNSIPPTLEHVSETIAAVSSRRKSSKQKSHHSQKNCPCYKQEKNQNRKKRRQRCNTLPFSDLTEYSDHLPDELRRFVKNTNELSQLQSRMHKLLYHLFPQLRSKLGTMTPESSHFKSLLSDLVTSLQLPDEEIVEDESSEPPPLIFGKAIEVSSLPDYKKEVVKSDHAEKKTIPINTPLLESTVEISQAAMNTSVKNHKENTASLLCEPFASVADINNHKKQQCLISYRDVNENDDIVPQLSQLSLQDEREGLRPSKVLLQKDPDILLKHFSRLSCSALQLLLPDLTVSLCNELAQSPHDLVIFIDNVMLCNSRRKSKQVI